MVYPDTFINGYKYKVGDICKLDMRYSDYEYGVVYSVPDPIYDHFDDEEFYDNGYYLKAICNDFVESEFAQIPEYMIIEKTETPEKYKEWLELISKMIKLGMNEVYIDWLEFENLGYSYLKNGNE